MGMRDHHAITSRGRTHVRAGVCRGSAGPSRARGSSDRPAVLSPEQAGYVATGARFQAVQSSVLLPDAANFASEVGGFGVSAQLWTKHRVVVLGVSNTTTAGNYFAAVAVFNRKTHALICSTAASGPLQCPNVGSRWTDGSVSFAPGDDMTLTVIYDRAAGRDHFFVDDNTSGVSLSYGGYVPGTGKNYTQARGRRIRRRPVEHLHLHCPRRRDPPGDLPGQRPSHLQRPPVRLLQLVDKPQDPGHQQRHLGWNHRGPATTCSTTAATSASSSSTEHHGRQRSAPPICRGGALPRSTPTGACLLHRRALRRRAAGK